MQAGNNTPVVTVRLKEIKGVRLDLFPERPYHQ